MQFTCTICAYNARNVNATGTCTGTCTIWPTAHNDIYCKVTYSVLHVRCMWKKSTHVRYICNVHKLQLTTCNKTLTIPNPSHSTRWLCCILMDSVLGYFALKRAVPIQFLSSPILQWLVYLKGQYRHDQSRLSTGAWNRCPSLRWTQWLKNTGSFLLQQW